MMNAQEQQDMVQARPSRTSQLASLQATVGDKFVEQGWYRQRREADRRIQEASGGQFWLLSPRYSGDDQPHWIGDRCGHRFFASLNDIYREGLDVNPYFHNLPPDVTRLGSPSGLAEYTLHISFGQAESVRDQQLAELDDDYLFYCHLHDAYYTATLHDFILSAQTTCKCPCCEEEYSNS